MRVVSVPVTCTRCAATGAASARVGFSGNLLEVPTLDRGWCVTDCGEVRCCECSPMGQTTARVFDEADPDVDISFRMARGYGTVRIAELGGVYFEEPRYRLNPHCWERGGRTVRPRYLYEEESDDLHTSLGWGEEYFDAAWGSSLE